MALNWLAGYDFLHGTDGEPDPLQVEVLQRIRELSKDAGNIGTLDMFQLQRQPCESCSRENRNTTSPRSLLL